MFGYSSESSVSELKMFLSINKQNGNISQCEIHTIHNFEAVVSGMSVSFTISSTISTRPKTNGRDRTSHSAKFQKSETTFYGRVRYKQYGKGLIVCPKSLPSILPVASSIIPLPRLMPAVGAFYTASTLIYQSEFRFYPLMSLTMQKKVCGRYLPLCWQKRQLGIPMRPERTKLELPLTWRASWIQQSTLWISQCKLFIPIASVTRSLMTTPL